MCAGDSHQGPNPEEGNRYFRWHRITWCCKGRASKSRLSGARWGGRPTQGGKERGGGGEGAAAEQASCPSASLAAPSSRRCPLETAHPAHGGGKGWGCVPLDGFPQIRLLSGRAAALHAVRTPWGSKSRWVANCHRDPHPSLSVRAPLAEFLQAGPEYLANGHAGSFATAFLSLVGRTKCGETCRRTRKINRFSQMLTGG